MKTTVLSLALCIMAASTLSAQKIGGIVVDENRMPMEYVNVVLLNRADSAYIAGTVTDERGVFAFTEQPAHAAMVKLTSVGYAPQLFDAAAVHPQDTIAMTPMSFVLGEIVVRSNLPTTAIKGDALVTNVENSILSQAGTANDVLTQVPMVLGRDGNYEVFGKGVPVIYINGRMVHDTNELSQLNSADIRSVEVITNPGAKYDASVTSVIRIRTKRPQGDGFSGTLRTQNGFQRYFRTADQVNLKYRTGGLEVFGNFSYFGGQFEDNNTVEMLTQSTTVWNQTVAQEAVMRTHDFYGKAGFSYLFNENHSIGAYYSNGFTKQDEEFTGFSSIIADGNAYDELDMTGENHNNTYPKHHANLYYNGMAGKLGIDFNADFMWREKNSNTMNDEASQNYENSLVNSQGTTRSRLFAEKLVLSYPLWKGRIEVGEEFTASRFSTTYATDAAEVNDATSQVDEKNIAAFLQIKQTFGVLNMTAGVRYEHVAFDYTENGVLQADQSKSFDNLYPSLGLSAMIKNVQLSLNYAHKTQRPTYEALDGTVDYINRITLESGNPYLRPEKIHTVDLTAAWRQFFAQVSYTYKKDPILNTSRTYDEAGEIKLITKENFPEIQQLEAFVGAQFKVGIWQPKVNAGIIKQWLAIDYAGGRINLDKPLGLIQWQNAIHLPGDIWLNVDMQWMSAGNGENVYMESTAYLNCKLYKAFFNNRFSITFEANDILNTNNRNFTFYNKDVTIHKVNNNINRSFMLTLQYTFNTTRDRYRGQGAGHSEISRF